MPPNESGRIREQFSIFVLPFTRVRVEFFLRLIKSSKYLSRSVLDPLLYGLEDSLLVFEVNRESILTFREDEEFELRSSDPIMPPWLYGDAVGIMLRGLNGEGEAGRMSSWGGSRNLGIDVA